MNRLIYCFTHICRICTLSDHKSHSTYHRLDVLPKEDFISVLEPLKQTQTDIQQVLNECDRKIKMVRSQKESLNGSINTKFELLHQLLDQRKATLLTKLQVKTGQKMKELAAHRNTIEIACARMSSCLKLIESSLDGDTESSLVALRVSVLKQVKELATDFNPNTLQPWTMNDTELVNMNTADKACEEVGELVCDPVIAEMSYVTGKGTVFAIAQAQSEVQMHLVTQRNRESKQPVNIAAELVHIKTRSSVSCQVKDASIIAYRPEFKGKHVLQIRVNDKDIQESPLPIAVAPSMESLHVPRTIRNLSMPYGTATNSRDELIAIERHDYHKHCVTIVGSTGGKMSSFGTRGIKSGHFDFPRDVTIDPDDNIFVADKDNHRIQKFTRNGKFTAAVGCQGYNNLEFHCPNGIAIDKVMYHLYVCDQLNHRIQVITRDFKFVRNFGSKGEEEGQFKSPMFACFDERNNIYVTDFGNNRVQVFNDEGYFLCSFSDKANGEKLEQPFAIAIDSCNIVYVSEWEKNCISLFTANGSYIMSFGSSGSKDGEFNKIRGIHIDRNDFIYVSDHKNNRVQIFN